MQLTGNANTGTAAEVDQHTLALRANLRPMDYGSLGYYPIGVTSGTMAAGLAGGSPIFSARYTGTNLALLWKLVLTGGNTATAFSAGVILIQSFFARGFSASDTGGTSVAPNVGGNKARTSNMGSFGIGDYRVSSTGTLSAGTRTLDTQPFSCISASMVAVAGTPFFGGLGATLFQALPGEYPLTFAQNEGFVIQATVPATGTWQFSVNAVFLEILSTNWY